jgi:hypothetical protein
MTAPKAKASLTVAALMLVGACVVPSVRAQDSALIFADGFETGTLNEWIVSGENQPVVQDKKARMGRYALRSTLNFFNGDGASPLLRERTEVRSKAPNAVVGNEYWYGFSIYLPGPEDGADSYVPDKYWEIVTQWYAPPDDSRESGRNPPLTLKTSENGVGGRWFVGGKSSALAINSKGEYDNVFSQDLGPYETGKWTDWVFRIKWSYKSDGLLEVWKDGKKVYSRLNAPIGFNDKVGPFFKMGIYKGAWELLPEDGSQLDKVKHRVIYHDEFRMADERGSYDLVAPDSYEIVPKPPSSISIE